MNCPSPGCPHRLRPDPETNVLRCERDGPMRIVERLDLDHATINGDGTVALAGRALHRTNRLRPLT
jgi:hypothetical protein